MTPLQGDTKSLKELKQALFEFQVELEKTIGYIKSLGPGKDYKDLNQTLGQIRAAGAFIQRFLERTN